MQSATDQYPNHLHHHHHNHHQTDQQLLHQHQHQLSHQHHEFSFPWATAIEAYEQQAAPYHNSHQHHQPQQQPQQQSQQQNQLDQTGSRTPVAVGISLSHGSSAGKAQGEDDQGAMQNHFYQHYSGPCALQIYQQASYDAKPSVSSNSEHLVGAIQDSGHQQPAQHFDHYAPASSHSLYYQQHLSGHHGSHFQGERQTSSHLEAAAQASMFGGSPFQHNQHQGAEQLLQLDQHQHQELLQAQQLPQHQLDQTPNQYQQQTQHEDHLPQAANHLGTVEAQDQIEQLEHPSAVVSSEQVDSIGAAQRTAPTRSCRLSPGSRRRGKSHKRAHLSRPQGQRLLDQQQQNCNLIHESATYKDSDIEHTDRFIIVTNSEDGRTVELSNEDLTNLTVRQLNKIVSGFPKETIGKLKQRRRTLKNRGYAQNCRHKRLNQKTELEEQNKRLRESHYKQMLIIDDLQGKLERYEREMRSIKRQVQPDHRQQQHQPQTPQQQNNAISKEPELALVNEERIGPMNSNYGGQLISSSQQPTH